MLKFKDYEIKEFKSSPKTHGLHIYKDNTIWGCLVIENGMVLTHLIDCDEFIKISSELNIEDAIYALEAAYKRMGECNVIELDKFRKKKE